MTNAQRRSVDRAISSGKVVLCCHDGVNWNAVQPLGDRYLVTRGDTPEEAYENAREGLRREISREKSERYAEAMRDEREREIERLRRNERTRTAFFWPVVALAAAVGVVGVMV